MRFPAITFRYAAFLALSFALMMTSFHPLGAAPVALVKDGKAVATIVVPDDAGPQLRSAAETLRDYVAQSTGADLPVVTELPRGQATAGTPQIHVGQTDLVRERKFVPGDLPEDGFILKRADATTFVIAGLSDWGTEFGVYEFLERFLGVRWLAPTKLFTDVPKMREVLLPDCGVVSAPVYLSRELYPLLPEDSGEDPLRAEEPFWYTQADRWGRMNKLRAHVAFHHNLLELLPPSKFGVSHPEFFPVLNGERMIPPDDVYFEWQPNFSAPEIVEVSAQEIISYFDQNPEKSSFSLGINDSKRFDQSPESKARRNGRTNSMGLEDVSDDYFQWANEVVALVHEKHPGKRFGVLAYLQVLDPPSRVKLSSSIVPFITYELTRWKDPQSREKVQNLTLAWGKVAPVLAWYDYVYGMTYMVPRAFPHAEQEALAWGAKHQVKYYYAEALPNWGEGPSLWVLTKLLWNPEQNVDELLKDWCRAAVGEKAAPALQKYYGIWEKFWNEDLLSSRWYSRTSLWQDFELTTYLSEVPIRYMEESERLMVEVVAAADTPERKGRAESLQTMWKLYRASVLARQGDDLWKTANLQNADEAMAYAKRCEQAIQEAENRLRLLGEMARDPLHGHTVWRIARAAENGTTWGCASLWALAPWVGQSAEVKTFLEGLASKDDQADPQAWRIVGRGETEPLRHEAPKTAALVLAASGPDAVQMLQNSSFENGLESWTGNGFTVSSRKVSEGKKSLEFSGQAEGVLSQNVPYQPGTYYATFRVFVPRNLKRGEVRLTVTARNEGGVQTGPLLPTGTAVLVSGEWSTFVMPFALSTLNHPASTLEVLVEIKDFSAGETLFLDDFGIFRCDDQARAHRGAGPDGE